MKEEQVKKGLFIDLAFILALGLIPLTWFLKNHFILSVDSNLPFTLERWINELFYTWDTHLKAGWVPRMVEPTHFFFFVQWFFQWLGLNLLHAQRAVFVFWFTLPALTTYFLMRYLFRELEEKPRRLASITAVLFSVFNLYQESNWLGLSVSNLLANAFLPLFLLIWMRALEERRNPIFSGFIFGLVSMFSSGVANNPALVCVMVIPFLIFSLGYIFKYIKEPSRLTHLLLFILYAVLFSFLFNFYWIISEYYKVFGQAFTTTQVAGKGFIVDAWLQGISKFASFWNVIRMQGAWTWYAEPRPYALFILNNPFFILISWMVPLAGCVGLFFRSRYRWFFASILGVGIILSMGVHFPFEKTYTWMVQHIPFFWLVRSPWFKFMLLTYLGYSYFMGVVASKAYVWSQKKYSAHKIKQIIFRFAICAAVVLLPMVYAYPVTLGKVFVRPGKSGYSNHFQVPDYVYRAGEYLDKQTGDGRIWVLPGKGFFVSDWGFSGFTPFLPYIVQKPIVYTDHNLSIPISQQWLSEVSHPFQIVQNSFEKQLSPNLYRVARLFNVDKIVAEKDFKWAALPIPFSLKRMQESLSLLHGIEWERSFGEWDIYRIPDTLPYLYLADQVTYVEDDLDALIPLSNTKLLDRPALFFANQLSASNKLELFETIGVEQLVLHDKNDFDFAVGLIDPVAEINFNFTRDDEKLPSAKVFIPETGLYSVYATTGRRLLLSKPRSLVDRLEGPQFVPVNWNANLLSNENWISINKKRLKLISEKPQWSSFSTMGKKWKLIGEETLERGEQEIQLLGKNYDSSDVTVKIVSSKAQSWGFKMAEEVLQNKEIGYRLLQSTDPAWSHADWVDTDLSLIENNKYLTVELVGEMVSSFPFQNSPDWHPLIHKDPSIRVNNSTDKPIVSRIAFQIISVQPTLRELYIYLNGEEVKILKIPKLEKRAISLSLTFEPGENNLSFHSNGDPEPLSRFFKEEDDREVIMLLKDIKVGDLAFEQNVFAPQRDVFQFRAYPFVDAQKADRELNSVDSRSFLIDHKKKSLSLVQEKDKGRFWESKAIKGLNSGNHVLRLKERGGKNYFIELSSLKENPQLNPATSSIRFTKLNPTLIQGECTSTQPSMLVFSESFDPRWELSFMGLKLNPIKVNGYANSYTIPSTGGKTVPFQLEFTPQRWLRIGIKISLLSLMSVSMICLFLFLFSRNKRRK